MLVYIVNTYQEDGPEDIAATLHAAEIPEIINRIFDGYVQAAENRWNNYQPLSSGELQYEEVRRRSALNIAQGHDREMRDLSDSRQAYQEKIKSLTAAQFISIQSINLQDGWGGLQLHIVELT